MIMKYSLKFPLDYIHCNMFSLFNSLTTQYCVTLCDERDTSFFIKPMPI